MATTDPDAPDRAGRGANPTAVEDLTYEQAREELVAVVTRLETGDETLEGSLALWERGEALAARCQAWLDGAKARLDAAQQAAGGDVGGTPGGPTEGPAGDGTDDEEDA